MDGSELLIPLLMILGGIVVGFVGKRLLRIVIGLIGGGLLAYATWWLSQFFGVSGSSVYVLALLAFIIGYFLSWALIKLGIGIIAGIGIGLLLAVYLGLSNNIPMLILTVLISIGIMYLLADKILDLAISIAGVLLFYYGLKHFIPYEIAVGIAVLFFIFLIYWKVFRKK